MTANIFIIHESVYRVIRGDVYYTYLSSLYKRVYNDNKHFLIHESVSRYNISVHIHNSVSLYNILLINNILVHIHIHNNVSLYNILLINNIIDTYTIVCHYISHSMYNYC